ncbi:hypothetical protein H0H81_010266, partial [Sphagnurus paluster]
MYREHEELRYCEGHWKATRLATDTYYGWARGRRDLRGEAGGIVKSEPEERNLEDGTLKRKTPVDLPTGPAKIRKMS